MRKCKRARERERETDRGKQTEREESKGKAKTSEQERVYSVIGALLCLYCLRKRLHSSKKKKTLPVMQIMFMCVSETDRVKERGDRLFIYLELL